MKLKGLVMLAIFGDYEVEDPPESNPFVNLIQLSALSLLSGGLILSSIIVFANGGSLISGTAEISEGFRLIYDESRFVRGLLDWHDVWFSLPGIVFVIISILQKNKAE